MIMIMIMIIIIIITIHLLIYFARRDPNIPC